MARQKVKISKISGAGDMFSQLQHFSLPRAIREQIHSAIFGGKLKSGQRITEQSLCKQMGVSRTAVREAFQELRALGVLTVRRQRTYVVNVPGAEEIRNVYTLRGICEGMAAAAAKRHLSKGDFERLESLVRGMEEYARRGDSGNMLRADLAFHELIWRADRQEYLARVLQSLTFPYFAFLATVVHESKPATLLDIARVHRKYLGDLKRFSGGRLRARFQRHFSALGKKFHLLLRNKGRSHSVREIAPLAEKSVQLSRRAAGSRSL